MSDASLQASLHRPAGNPPAAVQPVVGQEKQLKQEHVNLTELSSDLFKTGGAGPQHDTAKPLTAAVNFSQVSSSTTSAPSTTSATSTTSSATLIGTSRTVQPQQKDKPAPAKKWGDRKAANDAGHKLPPTLASIQGNTNATPQPVNVVGQTKYHMPPAESLPPPVSDPSISSSSATRTQSDKSQDPGSNPNTYTYNPTETAAADEYVLDPHFLKHGTRRETLDLEIRLEPSSDGKGKTSAGDSTQGGPTTQTRQPEGLSDRCKWGTGVVASLGTCIVSLLFIDGPYVEERNDANFSNLLPGIGLAAGAILLIGTAFTLGKTHTH